MKFVVLEWTENMHNSNFAMVSSISVYEYKYKNKVYKVLVYEIFGPWMDRKDAQLQLCDAANQLWQVTTEHAAVAAAEFEEGKGGA